MITSLSVVPSDSESSGLATAVLDPFRSSGWIERTMHLPNMGFGALIPGPNMFLHTDTPSKSSGLAASVLGPFRSSGFCRERTMHLPAMGFGALSPGPFCIQTLKSSGISPLRPPESDSGMLSIGSLGLALSRSSELGSDAGNFCDFADFASSG